MSDPLTDSKAAPARVATGGRTLVVGATVAVLMGLVGGAFWHEDMRYSLPTPRPAALVQPEIGTVLDLSDVADARDPRPTLLHFFNPACPCSRFNLEHVRGLVAQFGRQVRFVAVLEDATTGADSRAAFARLEVGMPAVVDDGGDIAAACGVYSTPQAVLLEADGRLCFRGNYNITRYCADPATEFARLAILDLLARRTPAAPPPESATAYGCELPRFPTVRDDASCCEGGPTPSGGR